MLFSGKLSVSVMIDRGVARNLLGGQTGDLGDGSPPAGPKGRFPLGSGAKPPKAGNIIPNA